MGFLRNIVEMALQPAPIALSGIGAGAGTLLSDKEDIKDKLKTGLATGAGASAGVVLPAAYASIVDKVMEPGETKAQTLWSKLLNSGDSIGEEWYKSLGKNRAKYEYWAPKLKMKPEDMMDWARKAAIRRNAADKAYRILEKVRAKHTKLNKASLPLLLAAMAAGGSAGYNYMED